MALEVPPSRVPQGGRSPQAALTVFLVALVSIVGFALLGKAPATSAPDSSPPAALAPPSPSPAPSPEAAAVTPAPVPRCVVPRIVALRGPIARHPRPLAPTGFETLTPWTGGEWGLVADAQVGFWAAGSGRLTRLDASGTMTDSWTFTDDPIFGAWGIVPAREGGVWLWGGPIIAWFDGERLRDVIAAPVEASGTSWLVSVAEAADGSLWAAANGDWAATSRGPTYGGRVFHWDGGSWSDVCRPETAREISRLAVDAAGDVWVAPGEATADVSYFDGTTWSIPPSDPAWTNDPARPNAGIGALVAADDGSLWMAAGGLGRFDGKAWTSVRSKTVDLSGTVSLAAAPDGTVWAATGSVSLPGDAWGPHTGIDIARFDGLSWTVYDSTDGLPAPEPNSATITAVAASNEAVIAAARDGFYRLSDDRWVRAGPRPTAAAPAWSQRLLAVSAGEAWSATDDGLWYVRNGTWTKVPVAGWKPPLRAFDVARSPDGTLAVATDQGAAVLRAGRWTLLEKGEAHAVTFARDGVIWVAERASEGTETTVASFRFDGRAWLRTVLPTVTAAGWPMGLFLAPDGELWLLSQGWAASLDRFDGTRWEYGSALGGSQLADVAGLAVAPNGDLWVLAGGGDPPDWAVARYDGTTWTVDRASDGLAEPGNLMGPGGFAIAPDSSLWVATDRGLARFDGQRWSLRFAGYVFSALSFAPDGALWAFGPSGVQCLPANRLTGPDPSAR